MSDFSRKVWVLAADSLGDVAHHFASEHEWRRERLEGRAKSVRFAFLVMGTIEVTSDNLVEVLNGNWDNANFHILLDPQEATTPNPASAHSPTINEP